MCMFRKVIRYENINHKLIRMNAYSFVLLVLSLLHSQNFYATSFYNIFHTGNVISHSCARTTMECQDEL